MGKKKKHESYISPEVDDKRILMMDMLVGINRKLKGFMTIMSDDDYGVNTKTLGEAVRHLDIVLVKLHQAVCDDDVYEVLRVEELAELLERNGGR